MAKERYPETELLRQVPGVGAITATTFVLTVEDPARFPRARALGSYLLGRLGPDCDLKRWGLAMAERGGKAAKKRAVIAVACTLSVLLFRLWVTGEVYELLRTSEKRGDAPALAT
jgi:transposase